MEFRFLFGILKLVSVFRYLRHFFSDSALFVMPIELSRIQSKGCFTEAVSTFFTVRWFRQSFCSVSYLSEQFDGMSMMIYFVAVIVRDFVMVQIIKFITIEERWKISQLVKHFTRAENYNRIMGKFWRLR